LPGATPASRARNNGHSSMPSVNATSSVAMNQKSSIETVGEAIEESAAADASRKSAHYTGAATVALSQ
jgi:hypothetical protein